MPEEYQFSRRAPRCASCSREFARGEEHHSALIAEPPPAPSKKRRAEAKPPAAEPAASAEPSGADADAKAGGPTQPAAAVADSAPKGSSLPWRRLDFCNVCWKPEETANYFSFWKTAVPEEEATREKPLAKRIDAETVYEMFRRLEGQPELEKQKFRFILALILMRKKRLRFASVASTPQGEHLVLEDKAEGVTHKVRDPGLADEEIDSLKSAVDDLLRGAESSGDGAAP